MLKLETVWNYNLYMYNMGGGQGPMKVCRAREKKSLIISFSSTTSHNTKKLAHYLKSISHKDLHVYYTYTSMKA